MKQFKQKHILVADDEQNILDTLGFILESADYKVDLAANGKEALQKILDFKEGKHPIDLLVTDWRMPLMSGRELLNTLSHTGIKLPILIITSYNITEIMPSDGQSVNIEYLSKPFGDQEFLERIKSLFARELKVVH